jgi:methyl-accepting chemotaxis protein
MENKIGMVKRRKYFIKHNFQLKFAALIVFGILVALALMSWEVYYSIGRAAMDKGMDPYLLEFARSFTKILLTKMPLVLLVIVILSIFISHQISGPVYHLEKSMKQIKHGNFAERLRFRKSDELQELALSFNDMNEGLRDLVAKDRQQVEEISQEMDKIAVKLGQENLKTEDLAKIRADINKLNASIKTLTSHIKI